MLPVIVISMQSDVERRFTISKCLNEKKIPFTFIDAVVGKELPSSFLMDLNVLGVKSRKKRDITLGEIGCTLSHLKAYEVINELNIKYALILEDDVILGHEFSAFYNSINIGNPLINNDDIFILGGQDGIDKRKYISKSVWYKRVIGGKSFWKTIKSEEYIFRTCCYIVTDVIAERLLNLAEEEFFIADEWGYFKRKGVINNIYLSDFVAHPLDLSFSHIENERKEQGVNFSEETSPKGFKYFARKYLLANVIMDIFRLTRTQVRRFYL